MMDRRRYFVRYIAAFVVAAVAFACAVATASIAFGQLSARQARAAAIASAAFAERATFAALVDEETGVRGYVATGDGVFLEPYYSGSRAYAAYRAHPVEVDDPAVNATLRRLRAGGDALQPYFRSEIAAVARGDRTRAIANLPVGKAAFDRVRRMDAEATENLKTWLTAGRASMRRAINAAWAATIVMALVLIGAGTISTILVLRMQAHEALARRDHLTLLPNRRAFEERLGAAIAQRRDSERISVLYIDLDDFKPVNDRLGHAAGDKVLAACGERLRRCVRPTDFVARVGGDEFAAIVDASSAGGSGPIAARIVREIEAPYAVGGTTVRLGASIGVAVVPDDGTEVRDVVHAADEAMYRIKRQRRGAPA
jgi:diguanylate cyclase (GGDEF)-like protein